MLANRLKIRVYRLWFTLMYTIIALGNPGMDYERTRHNAGRLALLGALRRFGHDVSIRTGTLTKVMLSSESVRVFIPDTYMNDSGRGVVKTLGRDIAPHIIVIYDEIDLPLGEFKLSVGRGSGGHNGVQSIIDHLGTKDFIRVRIGIAPRNFWGKVVRPEGEKLASYVLGRFSNRELTKLSTIEEDLSVALETIVTDGIERAMNKFN